MLHECCIFQGVSIGRFGQYLKKLILGFGSEIITSYAVYICSGVELERGGGLFKGAG
jgi:hypothetical protein